MDMYSGYNKNKIHVPDQEHTSFIIEQGRYCYKGMPFGLKNASAPYQRMVNRMFAKQIGDNMEVYVNDMLVKIKLINSNLIDLEETYVIPKFRAKLNLTKCEFGLSSSKFFWIYCQPRWIEATQ